MKPNTHARAHKSTRVDVSDKLNREILNTCPDTHYNFYIVNTDTHEYMDFKPTDKMISSYIKLFEEEKQSRISRWSTNDYIIWIDKTDIEKKKYIQKYYDIIKTEYY